VVFGWTEDHGEWCPLEWDHMDMRTGIHIGKMGQVRYSVYKLEPWEKYNHRNRRQQAEGPKLSLWAAHYKWRHEASDPTLTDQVEVELAQL